MVKIIGENLQSTVRPGCLSIAAAIAIPNVLNILNLNGSKWRTHLVYEDRLPKILDKLDDGLGVLRFIQDPSGRPFL